MNSNSDQQKTESFRPEILVSSLIIVILLSAVFFLIVPKQSILMFQQKPTITPQSEIQPATHYFDDFLPMGSVLYHIWDAEFADASHHPVRISDFAGRVLILVVQTETCQNCGPADLLPVLEKFPGMLADGTEIAGWILLPDDEKTVLDMKNSPFQSSILYDVQDVMRRTGLKTGRCLLFFNPSGMLVAGVEGIDISADRIRNYAEYSANGGFEKTESFILEELLESDGSIYSGYRFLPSGVVQKEDTILSESLGILLEYAVNKGDQNLFDRVYSFIKTQMTVSGLVAWRMVGKIPATVNATLDDLRIIAALDAAEARWGGYQADIDTRSASLLQFVERKKMLSDFYDWELKKQSEETKLCYLDMAALDRLSADAPEWQEIRESAVDTLKNGVISKNVPLYYASWNLKMGAYLPTDLHMSEAMLTVLQSARAGVISIQTVDYIKTMLREHGIWGMYNIYGTPVNGYFFESTGTYAILIQVGLEIGDDDLVRLALRRMEHFRLMDGNDRFVGSYTGDTQGMQYTFDQLCALIAWQQLIDSGWFERQAGLMQ